jgi:hypothetical protein
MSNILEISNWNQLVRAESDYNNLKIFVKQYNSEQLTGTQIIIADYNNDNVYFSGFVKDLQSTLIPTTSTISNDDMLNIINSFGFNVAYSQPIVLSEEVITILKGYLEQGYKYVYKDYPKCLHHNAKYAIFVSDLIDHRFRDPIISESPTFIEDMWEWCIPFKTYPIQTLVNTGTVDNGLSI